MENIILKRATASDLAQLQVISKQTFLEAFSSTNNEDDMIQYVEKSFSRVQLQSELENNDTAFYLATLADSVIGYLKLNFGQSQTELKDKEGMEIERIYVSKDYLGKEVGKLLMEKAIQVAQSAGVNYVWLGVWEENSRAISFYQKNGFIKFDQHPFMLGNDEQTDIMMKLIL